MAAAPVASALLKTGVAAGVPAGDYYAGLENGLIVTVTEKRSKAQIDRLARALQEVLQCN